MTEKKDFPVFRVGIVTLSDKGYQGEREDKSGPKIKELLPAEQYEVVSMRLLPDERAMIEEELIRLADLEQCDLVLTTGGTGFSMRDVTPEATLAVSGRVAPGIAEAIRAGSMAITKRAMLSRAVSAIRHRTLIINLPGSPTWPSRKIHNRKKAGILFPAFLRFIRLFTNLFLNYMSTISCTICISAYYSAISTASRRFLTRYTVRPAGISALSDPLLGMIHFLKPSRIISAKR